VAAALGMGAGGALFGIAALAGLQAVLLAVPGLYLALRLAGGAYLVYLGVRLWVAAKREVPAVGSDPPPATASSSFRLALLTQLSNPKTALVYAGVFASLLPADPSWGLMLALPPLVFAVEAGWYSVVAIALSARGPQAAYLRSKKAVDRIAGGAMAALGLRLLIDRGRPA
jgi:threonine/homoserine/homoserine lactone efflux protein